jgi:hypothetical protein
MVAGLPSKEAKRVRFGLIYMAHEGCPSQLVAFNQGGWRPSPVERCT